MKRAIVFALALAFLLAPLAHRSEAAESAGAVALPLGGDLHFFAGGMNARFLIFENWDSTFDYANNTIVKHGGQLWVTLSDPSLGDEPGVATEWIQLTGGGGATLTQEQVEDFVGAMVDGNTETNITVTYDDAAGKLNFVVTGGGGTGLTAVAVAAPLTGDGTVGNPVAFPLNRILPDPTSSSEGQVAKIGASNNWVIGDDAGSTISTVTPQDVAVTGTAGSTGEASDAGHIHGGFVDTNTQLTEEQVEDFVGGMVSGNTETNIQVTYDDTDGTLDFVVTSGGGDGISAVASDSTLSGDGTSGNPLGIADDGVTTAKILDGSVTSTDIANQTIAGLDIASRTVGPSNMNPAGSTDGQVLTSTGPSSDPAWETPTGGGGGLSTVASDSTLTGDGTSGSPLGIADDGVTQDKIRDDSVGADEIIENSINTNHILANAVESVDILNETITAADIAPNAVANSEVADNAIGSAEIQDNAVGFSEMANDSVGMLELRTDTNTPAHEDLLIWNNNAGRMEWRDDTHILLPIPVPPSGFISLEPGQAARYRGRIVWNGSTTEATGINESTIDAIIRSGQLIYISSDLGVLTGNRDLSNVVIGDKFVADGVSYVVTANRAALFDRDDLPALVADGTLQRLDVNANPAVTNPTRLRTMTIDGTPYKVESIVYPADGSASLPTATSADWDSASARSKVVGFLDHKFWTVTRGLAPGHVASGTWTPVANNTTFSADGENYRWRGFHSSRPSNPQEFDFYWDTDDDFLHVRIHTGGVGFWVRQNQYNFIQAAMRLVIGLPYNYFTTQADALAHIHENGQRAVYLDTNGNRVLATVSSFSAAVGSQYTYTWTPFLQEVIANPDGAVDSGQVLKLQVGGRVYDAAPVRLPVSGALVAPTADEYDAANRGSRYLGWDGDTLQEVERTLEGVHSADATFTLVANDTNFGPFDGTTYRYRGAFHSQAAVSNPQANDFYFDTGYLEIYLCSDLGGTQCVFGNIAHSGLTSRLVRNIGYVAHEPTYTGALGIVGANGETIAIDKMPWPAKGEILVSGTEGTQIPLGTQVQTAGNVVFQTYEAGAIPAAGMVALDARAVLGGTAGNIADDTVLTLVAAIAGVTGITAEGAFAGGDDLTSGWQLYTVSDYQAPDSGHYSYDWIPYLDPNTGVAPNAGQLYELRVGNQVFDTAPLRLPVDGQITLPVASDWSDQYGRSRHVWFDGRHLFRVIKIRNTVTTAPSATFTEVPEFTTLNVATTSTNFRWRRTHWQDNLVSNPQRWDLYARRPDYRLRYYDGNMWQDLALTGSFNGHAYRGWWDDEDEAVDHVSANSQYVGYGFALYQVSDYDDGTDVVYTYDFENMLPEGTVLDPSDASLLDHLHEREPRDVDVTFAPLETDGHYRGWSTIGPGNGAISEAPPSDSDILEIGFVDPNYSFTSFWGRDSGFLGHLTLVVDETDSENQYEGARLRFKGTEFTFHEAPYDHNNNRGRYLSNTFVRLADQPARNAQGAFNVENVHAEDIALGGTAWLWHTMRASPSGSSDPALTEVATGPSITGDGTASDPLDVAGGDIIYPTASLYLSTVSLLTLTAPQYPDTGDIVHFEMPSNIDDSSTNVMRMRIQVGTVAQGNRELRDRDGNEMNPVDFTGGRVYQVVYIAPDYYLTSVIDGTAGGGLSQAQVDARVVAGTLPQARAGNTDQWTVQKLGAGTASISTFLRGDGTWQPVASGGQPVSTDSTIDGDGTAGDPLGLADDAVTSAHIAANTITQADIATNGVGPNEITNSAVSLAKINPSGSTDGQVITSTGPNSTPAWETPTTGSGGLTLVTSDATLSGDGTSGDPLGVADSAINHAKFGADVGGHTHISNGAASWDSSTNTITVPVSTRDPGLGDAIVFRVPDVGDSAANTVSVQASVNGTLGVSRQLLDIHGDTLSSSQLSEGDLLDAIVASATGYNLIEPLVKDFADASVDVGIEYGDLKSTNLNNLNFRPVQWDGTNFRVGTLAQNTLASSVSERLLIAGGDNDQCLTKRSSSNYEVDWSDCGSGGGGLSSVTIASPGALEGNGTSGSPLDVRDSGITTTHIQNSTVTTFDIQDGTIIGTDLANNSITTAKIADANVHTSDLNADAVTPEKISTAGSTDGQVLTSTGPSSDPAWETLPSGTVSQETIEDYVGDMVTGNTETGVTVTYQDSDGTLDFVVSGGGGGLSAVASDSSLGGDGTSGDPLGIADGGVGHDQIANDSISRDKMRNDSVGTSEILDSSITSVDIANATIAALDIANDAVTPGKIDTTGSTDGQVLMSTGPTSDPTWGSVTRSGVGTQYIDSANHLSFGNSVDVVITSGEGYVQNVGDIIEFHWFGSIDTGHYNRDVTIRFGTGGTSVPVFWRIDDASTEMHGEDVLPDWSYQLIRRSARWDLINMVPPTPGHWSKSVTGDVATGRVLTSDGDGGYTWETPSTGPDSLGGIVDSGETISINELYGTGGWEAFSSTGVTETRGTVGSFSDVPVYSNFKAGVYRLEWHHGSVSGTQDENLRLCLHKHTSAPTTLLHSISNSAFQLAEDATRVFSIAANEFVWFRHCGSEAVTTTEEVHITMHGH